MATPSIIQYSSLFFSTFLILVFMNISPTYAQQSFRPPEARLPVSNTLTSRTSASTSENQTTSSFNNNYSLSIIRFCSVTVLVLILILPALVQLISLLKGRGDDVGSSPVPTQLMHHYVGGLDLPPLFIMQQAPLAAPHPHGGAQISMAAIDHVEIDV